MRITLVISSMSCGGAERVMSILSNYWVCSENEVTLITVDSQDNDFYELDSRVKRIGLDLKKISSTVLDAVRNNITKIRMLRKAIKSTEPHVVISFIDRMNVITLLSTRWLSVPVIVSEHTNPIQLPPGGAWNVLRKIVYLSADAVIVLNDELKGIVGRFIPHSKLHVIPNPAITSSNSNDVAPPFDIPSPCVVAMGRLVALKGFDLLIEAFDLCEQINWSLIIMGEGEERSHLETLIKDKGLESRVYLPGNVQEPASVLSKADIFVLSSRIEGFPMAILEAMSCGLPVISFDCKTGPSTIIDDGVNGILVPEGDVDAMANSMNYLMSNQDVRLKYSKSAPDVVRRYSIESIMDKWNILINDLIRK